MMNIYLKLWASSLPLLLMAMNAVQSQTPAAETSAKRMMQCTIATYGQLGVSPKIVPGEFYYVSEIIPYDEEILHKIWDYYHAKFTFRIPNYGTQCREILTESDIYKVGGKVGYAKVYSIQDIIPGWKPKDILDAVSTPKPASPPANKPGLIVGGSNDPVPVAKPAQKPVAKPAVATQPIAKPVPVAKPRPRCDKDKPCAIER